MRRLMALLICGVLLLSAIPSRAATPEGGVTPPTSVGEESKEEKKETRVATTVEKGGTLLPAWRLVVEPFFEYDHFSGQNVSISGFTIFEAILIGTVTANTIKRDIFMPGVNLRLGMKQAELYVKIPYAFRTDQLVTGGSTQLGVVQKNTSDNAMGDVESYLYYQLLREGTWRRWVPDTIIRLGAHFPTGKDPYNINRVLINPFGFVPTEFPTGTGHYGVSGGVTMVKSADPAVLFLNLAYYYNFSRQVGIAGSPPVDFGDIKLGNSFEYSLGLIFALQERLSMNFSLQQRITGRTTSNGRDLPATSLNAIVFNIGATYIVNPRFTLDFLVGIGLSGDAPSVSALVRLPISFQFGGGR